MQELQEQKIEKPTTLPVDPCYMATWRSLDEKALVGMKILHKWTTGFAVTHDKSETLPTRLSYAKGQLISKANLQAEDSSKKRTKEFVFTSMRRVFVRFLEESSARILVSRLSDL